MDLFVKVVVGPFLTGFSFTGSEGGVLREMSENGCAYIAFPVGTALVSGSRP
jgi:hypothetical protein